VVDPRRTAPGWATARFDGDRARVEVTGRADLRAGDAVDPSTRFRWFSVTKLVTAACVLRLVEAGRLGLDDDARRHLPWFDPAARVTVRHLLSHASGLANPNALPWVHPPGGPTRSPARLTRALWSRHRRLRAPPGVEARYSNLGYLVLGELVAALDGSFEDAALALLRDAGARTASFDPRPAARGHEALRSARSAVMAALFARKTPRLVAYAREGWIGLTPFVLEGRAYGGLVGSIEDLAALGRALIEPGVILSRRALDAMARPHARGDGETYGLAFYFHPVGWLGHGGAAGGYRADLFLDPSRRRGVAILANAGDAAMGEALLRLTGARRRGR